MAVQVAFIGYGEVGTILAEDLRAQDLAVAALDIKLGSAARDAMFMASAFQGSSG